MNRLTADVVALPTASRLLSGLGSCRTICNSTWTSWRPSSWEQHLNSDRLPLKVAGSRLQVAPKLKSLGVTIDSRLRFDCHAKDVARACNYHTRALRHVRSLLSNNLAQPVACSIVASRLDYCSAMLRTIAQLCPAISSQLRQVLTIGKILLNSNVSSTCPHHMVNLNG